MTDRPPTPQTPTAAPSITGLPAAEAEERTLATTAKLAETLEDVLDVSLEEAVLERVLLELDRREYVDWVATGPGGTYVWDLTESPERIADALATAIVSGVRDWLESE